MKVYHAPVSLIAALRLSTQSHGSHYFPERANKRGTFLLVTHFYTGQQSRYPKQQHGFRNRPREAP